MVKIKQMIKLETHDLTLEVNNITKQLQTQTLDSSQQENLFSHNHEIQMTKNLLTKNIALFLIEHIIPSRLVSKNNAMMKTKEMLMQDQNLLRNHFYNTFVLPQTTEQNDMIHDIEVEVQHGIVIIPKTTIRKIDVALHLKTDLVLTRIQLFHNTPDQDMTIINDTRDLIALLIDPPTNHLIT